MQEPEKEAAGQAKAQTAAAAQFDNSTMQEPEKEAVGQAKAQTATAQFHNSTMQVQEHKEDSEAPDDAEPENTTKGGRRTRRR